jgi:hypothetical protein
LKSCTQALAVAAPMAAAPQRRARCAAASALRRDVTIAYRSARRGVGTTRFGNTWGDAGPIHRPEAEVGSYTKSLRGKGYGLQKTSTKNIDLWEIHADDLRNLLQQGINMIFLIFSLLSAGNISNTHIGNEYRQLINYFDDSETKYYKNSTIQNTS